MEKVAQRSPDDVTPSSSVNSSKQEQEPISKNRSNPAFVTVSEITPSAEITIPTTITNKLRSVPIPQPLLINSSSSKFSSTSMSKDDSTHSTCSSLNNNQLPPPATSEAYPFLAKQPKKKKSIFTAATQQHGSDEYASSPGSSEATSPQSNTPLFSPKFANSPPAGSGGKYMMKSKRTSWIMDAGAASSIVEMNTTSTPTTPISLPTSATTNNAATTKRSRKSSTTVDKRFILPLDESATSTSSLDNMHYSKSGSISKLRENRSPPPKLLDGELENQPPHHHHDRNSSISSILTDNMSMISCSDEYESSNDCDSMSNINKCMCRGNKLFDFFFLLFICFFLN